MYAMSNTFGFGGHNACVVFQESLMISVSFPK